MVAFDGIAPHYHIELREKPTIVWDYHSLLLAIQMIFSFMLTDEKSPLKLCLNCQKAFLAPRPNMVFCSPQCRKEYGSRRKINEETDVEDED